jgi:DNA segregation ATPase FtsK/SpoIIIE-like protein
MPRIVVMVDEFHMLLDPPGQDCGRCCPATGRLSRDAVLYGVHIILASPDHLRDRRPR